jgi:prepilin-type N-terminal cleavage/methylation domain-containing protein
MLKKLKKEDKGFTIIEVMIVLAIAALILLIVLVAIPALQRSQRNTARKNDASRIASSYSQYLSDNNNTAPVTATNVAAGSQILDDAGGDKGMSQFKTIAANTTATPAAGKLTVTERAPGAAADETNGTLAKDNTVVVVVGYDCTGAASTTTAGPGLTMTNVSATAASVIYPEEIGGGFQMLCDTAS